MHEYSVVIELIAGLLPQLEAHPGQITAVFLSKGELRILSDRALQNAFEVVAQGTRLAGARLEIETIPARVKCPSCGYEGPAEHLRDDTFHYAVPVLTCPKCRLEVDLVAGRELYVDRVSLHEPARLAE